MNYDEYADNIKKGIKLFEKALEVILSEVNIERLNIAANCIAECLHYIPNEIKKTDYYKKIDELQEGELTLERIVFLRNEFRYSYDFKYFSDSLFDVEKYIANIILSGEIEKREKILIILAEVEELVYNVTKSGFCRSEGIKNDVKILEKKYQREDTTVYMDYLALVVITQVIFANTKSYENVDKRIPFRNEILHKGILDYTDEEIESVYNILTDYVLAIFNIKKRGLL